VKNATVIENAKPMSFKRYTVYLVSMIFILQVVSRMIIPYGNFDCSKAKEFNLTPDLQSNLKGPFSRDTFTLDHYKGIFVLKFILSVAPSYLMFYLRPWLELGGILLLSYKYLSSSNRYEKSTKVTSPTE
jgi:hypothetical protein